METQFITDAKGKPLKAIIDITDYKQFIAFLEEQADCELYDAAKQDVEEATYTLAEVAEALAIGNRKDIYTKNQILF